MELRTVNPADLRQNPNNPRKALPTQAQEDSFEANIKTIGILSPPLAKVAEDGVLEIIAGGRRTACAVRLGLAEIQVLVVENDPRVNAMQAVVENTERVQLNPVDTWLSIESLISADWTEAAIAAAFKMSERAIGRLRLLAKVHPGILDQIRLGDMPSDREIRIIASASIAEQKAVWKKNRPRPGERTHWWSIAQPLIKRTFSASVAKFTAAMGKAHGVVWTDDMFSEGGKDGRTTENIDQFLAAQNEWLCEHMPKKGELAELDERGQAKLPPKAMRGYGKPQKGDNVLCWVDPQSGEIEMVPFTIPEARKSGKGHASAGSTGVSLSPARAPISNRGIGIIGEVRTTALHQAIREKDYGDDTLIAMLVLALGGKNVSVQSSGISGDSIYEMIGWRERLGNALTEGGHITQDSQTIRAAAKEMLVGVLSLRDDSTRTGIGARYAGAAIEADVFLPHMADENFLSCLTKDAITKLAIEHGVTPGNSGKATRASLIRHLENGHFAHAAASFELTADELAEQASGRKVSDDISLDSTAEPGTGTEEPSVEDGAEGRETAKSETEADAGTSGGGSSDDGAKPEGNEEAPNQGVEDANAPQEDAEGQGGDDEPDLDQVKEEERLAA